MVSLVTYNIQFGKRLAKITNWLGNLPQKPEILCFQEFPSDATPALTRALGKSVDFVFAPSIYRRKIFGELTVFDRRKFSLRKSASLSLMNAVGEKLLFRGRVKRSSEVTTFDSNYGEFTVANVHLAFASTNKLRLMQLSQILDVISLKNHPQILVGDLNYTSLLGIRKLVSFMRKNQFSLAGRFSTHRLLFLRQQIDYVFHKQCEILHSEVIRVKYSDHFPTWVRFAPHGARDYINTVKRPTLYANSPQIVRNM